MLSILAGSELIGATRLNYVTRLYVFESYFEQGLIESIISGLSAL